MSAPPDRIKAWPWNGKPWNSGQWHVDGQGETAEYVLASTIPAMIAEAVALVDAAAIEAIEKHFAGAIYLSNRTKAIAAIRARKGDANV